jgi:hypothetical protein
MLLEELKNKNWNNPYIIREFGLNDASEIEYLLNNYHNEFAFGLKHNNVQYTIYKTIKNEFYIRNDRKYKFDFPKCPPPITSVYCLKTDSVDDVLKFIN